ncbi:hypothetical protein BOTBODRAFT_58057 [Botryobasidium botryosum FD-172 SS1]|uniref:SET domain-containing protein n=1 Tax=Botryobasidium botryosum (strain FD-172 SS1) TaxID=930990 RepID=A0A067MF65_BOTB1|nr:hypothetical protein BOTBODRAFT_58057 [Botryobasidium botryosum FD-172 SS1]
MNTIDNPEIVPDTDEEIAELVYRTWMQCHNEFYNWAPGACKEIMESISQEPPPRLPNATDELLSEAKRAISEQPPSPKPHRDPDEIEENSLLVWNFANGDADPSPKLHSMEVYLHKSAKPCPKYTSCLPTLSNLWIAEKHREVLWFPPFANDPTFDLNGFLKEVHYPGGKAWEAEDRDPDADMIMLETIRRLHFSAGLSFAEIDKTRVLPHLVDPAHGSEILDLRIRRNMFDMPSSILSELPQLPLVRDVICKDTLSERIGEMLFYQCNNLNCVRAMCGTHQLIDVVRRVTRPTKTKEEINTTSDPPCSPHCYQHLAEGANEELLKLTDSLPEVAKEDLKTIIEITPDLSSCDLAILADMTCQQVHLLRWDMAVHPSEDSPSHAHSAETALKEPLVFKSKSEGLYDPCRHKGRPCGDGRDENGVPYCVCHSESTHCQRQCGCDLDCERRRKKGCSCKTDCSDASSCVCVREKRECDPELCISCHAKSPNYRYRHCRNVSLLLGRRKPTYVAEGKYGWGLFATQDIKEGDIIGEYVGEVIGEEETGRRALLAKHTRLNYLFGLGDLYSIDSAHIGNETRFINHAKKGNCTADIKHVGGDRRIIFSATKTIKARKELFFDYGENYFV